MNVYSKGRILVTRNLRQLNGFTISLFDELEKEFNYPYAR